MINQIDFNKSKDGSSWWVSDTILGFEIIIPGNPGEQNPDEKYIAISNQILPKIDSIIKEIKAQYLNTILKVGKIGICGIEILSKNDRHGADVILSLDHDGDGYIWLECGIKESKPQYILLKWH